MKSIFLSLVAVTPMLPSCGKSSDHQAPTPSSTPPATPKVVVDAAFNLTVAMVRDYALPTLSDSFEANIADIAKHLGPPTRVDQGHATWAAADASRCSSLWIADDRSGSAPTTVEAKDFHEQWGKLCLLMAGVSPVRKPFVGTNVTPSSSAPVGSWQQVRVEGRLEEVAWDSYASRYELVITDEKDPKAVTKCKMELGASRPTEPLKSHVVAEGGTDSGNSVGFLKDCFFVGK